MKRSEAGLICLALLLLGGAGLRWTGTGRGAAPPPDEEGSASAPAVLAIAAPSRAPSGEGVWTPVPSGEEGTVIYAPSPAPEASGARPSGEGVWTPIPSGEEGTVIYAPSPAPEPGAARRTAGDNYDFSQAVPESEPVDEGYFADALFLGDSRTDGFHLYSGLEQGTFLVKTGLSVFHIESDLVKLDGEKVTVPQALERGDYGKVYVCLGLNELGMRDDQGYYDHYARLIDLIRASQPDATVYIQLLIPVNAQKCAEKGVADYINNDQIAVYNDLLRTLAQEKQVFFVDPAQGIVDESGQPPYDAVADGVHFKKEPYQRWLDYLKRHTISKGEWE